MHRTERSACRAERGRGPGCRCGGQVRGFIQPRLLLMLSLKPAHGYELMDALRSAPGDDSPVDPAMLYRTLRQFEQDGVVVSSWNTEGSGPARRIYRLTDSGREYLQLWVADIRKTRAQLEQFLAEFQSVVATPTSSQFERGN